MPIVEIESRAGHVTGLATSISATRIPFTYELRKYGVGGRIATK